MLRDVYRNRLRRTRIAATNCAFFLLVISMNLRKLQTRTGADNAPTMQPSVSVRIALRIVFVFPFQMTVVNRVNATLFTYRMSCK